MRPVPSVLDLASRRLASPRSPRGLVDTERVLATVRLVLAISSLLFIWFDPDAVSWDRTLVSYVVIGLIVYLATSVWLLLVVQLRSEVSPAFSRWAHITDILWPAGISIFAGGSNSPFFLYFIFALLAAAFRWGMRETSLTTVAVVFTMAADAVVIARTPLGTAIGQHVDVVHFVMRAAYLVIFAFLIGYVAESEKRRVSEALSISQMTAKIRVEAGLKGTMQTVFQGLLKLFGARELLVLTREAEAERVMLARAAILEGRNAVTAWRRLDEVEEQEYLCVVRELHDGVVQFLHAIAFRLYALRTLSTFAAGQREQELLDIQQSVQNEAANVRHLIQQLEPLDFDPRHLVDYPAGMVTRYRQDTGIGAQFVCDVADVNLPPPICRELAGILREALANVRRHSGAQSVVVRLGRQRSGWTLTIEDDGRGFDFAGTLSHVELEESRRGPLVVKQRVRAIGAELTIGSKPAQGARLQNKVPDLARASIA